MSTRAKFFGSIEGSVVIRPGETKTDALRRAEDTINALFNRSARTLGRPGEPGPVVGLEPANGDWESNDD